MVILTVILKYRILHCTVAFLLLLFFLAVLGYGGMYSLEEENECAKLKILQFRKIMSKIGQKTWCPHFSSYNFDMVLGTHMVNLFSKLGLDLDCPYVYYLPRVFKVFG